MLYQQDLENLQNRQPNPDHPVLSLYLDIDQSQQHNLNQGFVTVAKNQLRSLQAEIERTPERREMIDQFEESRQQLLEFISQYTPQGKSLVIFISPAQDFFWYRELYIPFRNNTFWGDTPYIYPLLEAYDEYERYGVVLADKAHARLFTIYMGEIEEHQTTFTEEDVRHVKTTGRDRLTSQMRFQRQDDTHRYWHLKETAHLTAQLMEQYSLDHIILGGTKPITDELYHLFPKRVRSRVARSISLATDASRSEVLDKTLAIEQEVEREHEQYLVDTLLSSSAEANGAVTGLEDTISALNQGQVWELLYADGFSESGYECPHCSTLFTEEQSTCSYCGSALRPTNLLEKATEHTLNLSGKVELVKGEAREQLQQAQGIGAFLRA
ncbi:hypothetical protein PCC7418_3763 [Halothece sp. PCC 7418]|uniref:baeRF10 domain-containing protein n=1 Tax=Halothece sp. (strain PCC 7418) TaxID=65093 RepID=UPI0002A066FB|nr:hypothetical protein [Halothece sp. PCC 7418]AFZ45867.1 hypothetical protein PCC7418_3763 [Halothece sp. PCC 7418]